MSMIKRLIAFCLILLILMTNAALGDVPFLVHSNGWTWNTVPVDVLLKADVDTHMPFDEDRLAMLTPITDMLSMHLITGENEGKVTISAMEDELLTLQYKDNSVQLSSMPGVTYTSKDDPVSTLLGQDVSADGLYELLGLARQGETLITDGRDLVAKLPAALEGKGKKSKATNKISGYGQAAYIMDFNFAADKASELKAALIANCSEGWLKEIIDGLVFSGKQTIRMYFTKQDVLLRMEYNGSCGPKDDLRTVKLVYKLRHDAEIDKDYVELTSPAKTGKEKNKNNLTFERTVQTNKRGARTVTGAFKYTKTDNGVTSVWDSTFGLFNDYTDQADMLTGEFTLEKKLNGDTMVDAITLKPDLTISGTADAPLINGTMTIVEKYAGRVTEQAAVSVDLKRAESLAWDETAEKVDLSAMDEKALTNTRGKVARSLAEAVVRPLTLKLGKDAQWFFRDLSEDVVQSVIDAAASVHQKED